MHFFLSDKFFFAIINNLWRIKLKSIPSDLQVTSGCLSHYFKKNTSNPRVAFCFSILTLFHISAMLWETLSVSFWEVDQFSEGVSLCKNKNNVLLKLQQRIVKLFGIFVCSTKSSGIFTCPTRWRRAETRFQCQFTHMVYGTGTDLWMFVTTSLIGETGIIEVLLRGWIMLLQPYELYCNLMNFWWDDF